MNPNGQPRIFPKEVPTQILRIIVPCSKAKELKNKFKEIAKNSLNADSQQLNTADVVGSLHYDEKLLIDLWHKRNPCHELNSNSGEDMFWRTAFMVFKDYVKEV